MIFNFERSCILFVQLYVGIVQFFFKNHLYQIIIALAKCLCIAMANNTDFGYKPYENFIISIYIFLLLGSQNFNLCILYFNNYYKQVACGNSTLTLSVGPPF